VGLVDLRLSGAAASALPASRNGHAAAYPAAMKRAVSLVVVVGLGVALGVSAPAVAATATRASLPAGAGADPNVGLGSMSCAPMGDCTAVGTYSDSSGTQGLLLSQSSGSWSPGVKAPLPQNAAANTRVTLGSVSCAWPRDCTAVGVYTDNPFNTRGLLLNRSSGAWSTWIKEPLPLDAHADYPAVSLSSVSCPSAGDCTAVGHYSDSSGDEQGLLVSRRAMVWPAGLEAPVPGAAYANPGVDLSSVSCASAGNCTAVGHYLDSSYRTQGLLLQQSSGSWSPGVKAALPQDAGADPYAGARSVSCASAGNCVAVGQYQDSSNRAQGLLLNEVAGSWSPGVKPPVPADADPYPAAALYSVSCPSAGDCAAVGSYTDGSGHGQGLLLQQSSWSWSSAVRAPLPADAGPAPNVDINSVSCVSAGHCTAVGRYLDSANHYQGLLLSRSAGTWSTGVRAPLPADAGKDPDVTITSVSCAPAGRCAAAGRYYDAGGHSQGLLIDVGSTSPPLGDRTSPVISSPRVSRSTLRIGPARSRRARRIPTSTTFSFRLSESARVTLRFIQSANGRRKGRKCVRGRRTGRRCKIALARGTLTINAGAGANRLAFRGKIGRRTLASGRYTVQLSARDKAGNVSETRRVTLTLVR